MNLENLLSFSETYARNYILYLVEFFGGTPTAQDPKDATNPEGKVVIFAVLSAVIGAFLGHKYISSVSLGENQILESVIAEFLYWIALAVLVEGALRLTLASSNFMASLISVLKVLPTAYASSGFVAFVMSKVSLVPGSDAALAAYFGAAGTEVVICAVYLPTMIHNLRNVGWVRSLFASALVVLTILLVIYTQWILYLKAIEHPSPPAGKIAVVEGVRHV